MTAPRIGIDFGSTGIKIIRMTPGADIISTDTLDMPTETSNNQIFHPPEPFLEQVRTIPETLSMEGDWQASITSQRSTFILWDEQTGEAQTPLISWRDRRAEAWVEELSTADFNTIKETTGLRPEAGYPLPKLRWLFNENDVLEKLAGEDRLRYGSLDTWLTWVATGGDTWIMDTTQASRTLLYDPHENEWAPDLLDRFDIPRSMLPDLIETVEEPIPAEKLWKNGEIVGLVGDQPASTIGGQPPPYEKTRVTLGTGGFVASPIEPDSKPSSLTLSFTPTPDSDPPVYQAEGVVLSAGRVVDWWIDVLGINQKRFGEFMSSPWPEDLPMWCPALNGVGAPFWSNRPATIREFSEATTTGELCQGLIVSILMRINDILELLPGSDLGVRLDGGLTRIPNLPQIATKIWDTPVSITVSPHLTCRGAVIASHWTHPYFDVDPWDSLELNAVEPIEGAPVKHWHDRWKESLNEWELRVEQ